jgi:hypothetical protein
MTAPLILDRREKLGDRVRLGGNQRLNIAVSITARFS